MSHIQPEQFSQFLQGTCGSEAAAQVELHIDGCPDCRMVLSSLVRSIDEGASERTLQVATSPVTEGDVVGGNYRVDKVLVETLFAWPGLGRLLSTAILNRDHPVLLGCFGLIVMMVIVSSVAADIVQARLDPRIAAGQGA
jgi:hypothetical protein